MSIASVHIDQAKHNQKAAKKLSDINFFDWAITAAFYSALHFLEAAFIKDPKLGHSEGKFNSLKINESDLVKGKSLHAFREMLISNKFPKDNIKTKFAQLRTMSEACRYIEKSGGKMGNSFISPKDVAKGLEDLGKIESATSS